MTVFEYKEGRKVVNDKDIAYMLPVDGLEVDRLKMNHGLWKCIIGGLFKSPIHDRLEKGIRVLDIGCGPGWWTLDMAKLYPSSEFIAIDMADIFMTQDIPPNVTFKQMNAGVGLNFEDESFDFVFQRFLVMGFPTDQYLLSIQEMKRLLKPGGAIEILELINKFENASPAFDRFCSWVNEALATKNLDAFVAEKIPGYLTDAGYRDIQFIDYNVPIGPWGGHVGKLYLEVLKLALPASRVMVVSHTPVTLDQFNDNLGQVLLDAHHFQVSNRYKLIYAIK